MTNLANQFTEIVRGNPNKTAIFWDGSEYSFGHAYSVAKCLSNRLKGQFELQSGDRVALWLKNCPDVKVLRMEFSIVQNALTPCGIIENLFRSAPPVHSSHLRKICWFY